MPPAITLRPLGPDDAATAGRIFFCAVHEGARDAYTVAERRAWAGDTIDLDRWAARLRPLQGFVAERAGEAVGFLAIDATGHLDLAFVLPSAARQGVGSLLLARAEVWARDHGAARLTTEASLVAHPFFLKNGWQVLMAETVLRDGVPLRRYRMAKDLA